MTLPILSAVRIASSKVAGSAIINWVLTSGRQPSMKWNLAASSGGA